MMNNLILLASSNPELPINNIILVCIILFGIALSVSGVIWAVMLKKNAKSKDSFSIIKKNKKKFNKLNFWVSLLIGFTGLIGAIVCTGILIGNI